MRQATSYLVVIAVLASAAAALAQPSDLSGTWRLDAEESRVSNAVTLAGLIGVGAPETLHITQPTNGTVVVESQINESHARFYVPGVETSTPVYVGEAGTITMTSRWDGVKLVSEGLRESSSNDVRAATEVKEVFALGADGQILEIEVTMRTSRGEDTSRLTYRRLDDVGVCESWPSPCKTPPR